MKLEKILDNLNSLEKNSFIKNIVNIIANNPKNIKEIERINDSDKELKSADSINIARIFNLVESEFMEFILAEFVSTTSQLDILVDILTRDGNNIMKRDWFAKLYDIELKRIRAKTKKLNVLLKDKKNEISASRVRDYKIYEACLRTAYFNDEDNNREAKITDDELTILLTLSQELELSQEEMKLINYIIIPPVKKEIEDVIKDLKDIGVVFYSKKHSTVYVADEMVRLLRKIRNRELADKFYRRVLKILKDGQINLVCRKHNISTKLSRDEKIKEIINIGVAFRRLLSDDIYKDGTSITERKKTINDLWNKGLKIPTTLKGSTLEDKISNIVKYFEDIEKDDRVGISIDGYDKLLIDLSEKLPIVNSKVREVFELQEDNVMNSGYLMDYNIKPRDVIDVISEKDLLSFCKEMNIKTRGDIILNILDAYKDMKNLYLENYVNIAFRDLNALKENGIFLKESELGIKFEDLTKTIFAQLGFNVDESLRKKLNTKKDKMDIVINLDNNVLIIIECKTKKESGYNKFSSVSRQLKAYTNIAKLNDYRVVKALLVAPDFNDEFINDVELEYELNLSLLTASSLIKILNGFKKSKKHKQFPYKLLMRDVLIKEDRILNAISK